MYGLETSYISQIRSVTLLAKRGRSKMKLGEGFAEHFTEKLNFENRGDRMKDSGQGLLILSNGPTRPPPLDQVMSKLHTFSGRKYQTGIQIN